MASGASLRNARVTTLGDSIDSVVYYNINCRMRVPIDRLVFKRKFSARAPHEEIFNSVFSSIRSSVSVAIHTHVMIRTLREQP